MPSIQTDEKISKKKKIVSSFFIPKNPKFKYVLKGIDHEVTDMTKITYVYEEKNAEGEGIMREEAITDQMIGLKAFINLYFEKAVILIIQIIKTLRKNKFTYISLE